jgi:hypothetical protein
MLDNQIKNNEKDGACGMCERQEFWWGDLRERDQFKGPGANGRITLKRIFKKRDENMDWIDLAHDRDKWQALVNAVMNLWVT